MHHVGEQHRHLLVLRRSRLACVSGAPHSLQNLEFGGSSVPHDPHNSPVAVSPPPPSPLGSTSVSFHRWSAMSVISPCHLRHEVLRPRMSSVSRPRCSARSRRPIFARRLGVMASQLPPRQNEEDPDCSGACAPPASVTAGVLGAFRRRCRRRRGRDGESHSRHRLRGAVPLRRPMLQHSFCSTHRHWPPRTPALRR